MDAEIVFGSEMKMRGNDIAEGYLVLFGSKTQTDKSAKRDYFTSDTDFGLDLTTKSRILYQHGFDKTFGKMTLAVGEMKIDDMGVWIEGQLKLREEYLSAIAELSVKNALGWSSGTASHLVEREKQDNGAHYIKTWHLGLDASLTPNPAEPRTVASIKSVFPPAIETQGFLLPDDCTERDFEKFLRDAGGFSAREAKAIISEGYRAIRSSRDAGDEATHHAAIEAAMSAYLATERKFASVLI